MAADFNKPVVGDAYANVLPEIVANDQALAVGLDPAVVTPTNTPTNAIRWRAAVSKWEKYNGSTWADLAATYAISISGNAATATTAAACSGNSATATSASHIAGGGAGQIHWQSSSGVTSLLAAGTAGYVLVSGGAATPAWVQYVPVANGGTGAGTFTSGGLLRGNGTSAFSIASAADIVAAISTTAVTNATNATNLTGSGTIATGVTGVTQSYGDGSTKIATTAYADGMRDVPANTQTASYTLALTDRGKSIDITTGGVLIPTNAAVAFNIGAVVSMFNNSASAQNVAAVTPGTTTVRKAGTATTGTLSIPQYGVATMRKVATDVWVVTGAN